MEKGKGIMGTHTYPKARNDVWHRVFAEDDACIGYGWNIKNDNNIGNGTQGGSLDSGTTENLTLLYSNQGKVENELTHALHLGRRKYQSKVNCRIKLQFLSNLHFRNILPSC